MFMFIFSNAIFSLILWQVLRFLNSFDLKSNTKLDVLEVSVLLPTYLNNEITMIGQ